MQHWVEDPREPLQGVQTKCRVLRYPPLYVMCEVKREAKKKDNDKDKGDKTDQGEGSSTAKATHEHDDNADGEGQPEADVMPPHLFTIPGLPPGHFPVKPKTTSVKVFDLHKKGLPYGNVTVSRQMPPLLPAQTVTGHGAQGLTLKNVVVDMAHPPPAAGGTAIKGPYAYVALSRVRKRDDVCIVRYDPRTLEKRVDRSVLHMNAVLDGIEDRMRKEHKLPPRRNPHPPLPEAAFAAYCTPENEAKLERLVRTADRRYTRVQEKCMMQRGRRGVEKALNLGMLSAEEAAGVEAELEVAANSRDAHKAQQLQQVCLNAVSSVGAAGVEKLQRSETPQSESRGGAVTGAMLRAVGGGSAPPEEDDDMYGIDEDELTMI